MQNIPANVALCLYRVAQEALSNIARHANAKRIRLHLRQSANVIIMTIADDGRGFNLSEGRQRGGLGLLSLDERVRLIRGSIKIDSRPGHGTELQVTVPLGASS